MRYDFLSDLAKTTFISDNYESLYRFFQRVWELDYDYKVTMARRAFNLNYAFLMIDSGSGSDEAYGAKDWISNTALLLYYKEIADEYLAHGRFPSILILDDLCLHGRSVAALLDELEQLIVSYLGEGREMGEGGKLSIHWALTAAIDIYVYARNEQYLLLEKGYRDKVHGGRPRPGNKLRELSLQISRFLQQSAICNTSYIVSFDSIKFLQRSVRANGVPWNYRGGQIWVYFPQYDLPDRESGLISTFRTYCKGPDGQNPHTPVSSLVLFSDMEQKHFSQLCEEFAEQLSRDGDFHKISEILCCQRPLLQKARAQMLSCILSIINSARSWYRDDTVPAGKYSDLFFRSSDIMKIISNFGRVSELKEEFAHLVRWAFSTEDAALSVLYQKAYMAARPLEPFQSRTITPELAQDINDAAEEIFYYAGMSAEEDAYRTRRKNSVYHYQPTETDPGVVPFRKYLDKMNKPGFAGGNRSNLVCMMNLMDCGLIAMNMALSDDGQFIYCTLKAGELSTYVMPRKFYLFLPALAKVEKSHWLLDLSCAEAVKRFIRAIEDDTQNPQERKALQKLKETGDRFVDLLYHCGQSFLEWDIELLTAEDRAGFTPEDEDEPFSIKRYLETVTYETDRQAAYLKQANNFIKLNSHA